MATKNIECWLAGIVAIGMCQLTTASARGAQSSSFQLGKDAIKDGRLDDAIKHLSDAIQSDPKNAKAWCARGSCRSVQGKVVVAIPDFDEAIRLDPKYGGAYANRGGAQVLIGNIEAGIEDLTTAIRLDDRDAEAYRNRTAAYATLIAKNTDSVDSTYSLAYMRLALSDADQAVKLAAADSRGYLNRGRLFAGWGDSSEAISDFTEAIRLSVTPESLVLRGKTYLKMHRFKDAPRRPG